MEFFKIRRKRQHEVAGYIGKWGGPGKIQGRSKKWIRSKYNELIKSVYTHKI